MNHQLRSDDAQRILLYSHDSFGLGHLRRTLTIAGALVDAIADASVLIVSGSPCATHFALPRGVEIVKLPAVTKDACGQYAPRNLRGGLALVERLRRDLLLQAFESFAPDLLIVDHQPVGLDGELIAVLRRARELGTRTLLGLRDIIDDPKTVAEQWSSAEIRAALRNSYDRVCVYGSAEVFDTRVEYPIPPELRERVEFTGYVVRPGAARRERTTPLSRSQVLVTAGGGEDGESHALAYLESLELAPAAWDTQLVLGPLMNPTQARRIKRTARAMRNVSVHTFHADLPHLLAEADTVVAMAGYNTVAEILQARVPAVLVPRVFPRREQLIRAQRLEALGLVRAVIDAKPKALRAAIEAALVGRHDWSRLPDMQGHARICEIAVELLGQRTARAASTAPALAARGSHR